MCWSVFFSKTLCSFETTFEISGPFESFSFSFNRDSQSEQFSEHVEGSTIDRGLAIGSDSCSSMDGTLETLDVEEEMNWMVK